MSDDDALVEVFAATSEATANLVRIALAEAGIDAIVDHADMDAILGTGTPGAAHAQVLVRRDDEQRARVVVTDWKQARSDD